MFLGYKANSRARTGGGRKQAHLEQVGDGGALGPANPSLAWACAPLVQDWCMRPRVGNCVQEESWWWRWPLGGQVGWKIVTGIWTCFQQPCLQQTRKGSWKNKKQNQQQRVPLFPFIPLRYNIDFREKSRLVNLLSTGKRSQMVGNLMGRKAEWKSGLKGTWRKCRWQIWSGVEKSPGIEANGRKGSKETSEWLMSSWPVPYERLQGFGERSVRWPNLKCGFGWKAEQSRQWAVEMWSWNKEEQRTKKWCCWIQQWPIQSTNIWFSSKNITSRPRMPQASSSWIDSEFNRIQILELGCNWTPSSSYSLELFWTELSSNAEKAFPIMTLDYAKLHMGFRNRILQSRNTNKRDL